MLENQAGTNFATRNSAIKTSWKLAQKAVYVLWPT